MFSNRSGGGDVFPALLRPEFGDVTSEVVVALGSRGMRLGGEEAVMSASFVG